MKSAMFLFPNKQSVITQSFDENNQRGIALVLVVLVLANLFIITLIVTDIVIRIGRGSHQIGQSEKAYLAAEAAVEEAIYTIESTRDINGLGLLGSPSGGTLSYSNSSWSRYADTVNQTMITCIDSQQRFSFPDDPSSGEALAKSCIYAEDINGINEDEITSSNPIKIRLKDGQSFRLDLDIANITYPDFVTLDWQPTDAAGQLIVISDGSQEVRDTSESGFYNLQIPISGDLNNLPHRIKVTNESGSDIIYTLTPSLSAPLPVGILIHSQGIFANQQERIIEVERRYWQIY